MAAAYTHTEADTGYSLVCVSIAPPFAPISRETGEVLAMWPTEKDREKDFETHRRVAEALAKTANLRTSPASANTSIDHRKVESTLEQLEEALGQSDLIDLYRVLRSEPER